MPWRVLTLDAFPAARPGRGRAHCQSVPCTVWEGKGSKRVYVVFRRRIGLQKAQLASSYAFNMTKLQSRCAVQFWLAIQVCGGRSIAGIDGYVICRSQAHAGTPAASSTPSSIISTAITKRSGDRSGDVQLLQEQITSTPVVRLDNACPWADRLSPVPSSEAPTKALPHIVHSVPSPVHGAYQNCDRFYVLFYVGNAQCVFLTTQSRST